MSRRRKRYDNTVAESLVSSLKNGAAPRLLWSAATIQEREPVVIRGRF